MPKKMTRLRHAKRNYGIDLLRCFAMVMVVMLHTLSKSGLLAKAEIHTLKYEIVWFLEICCYCAVDCFVIISGYVGLHSKFRISRILQLWLQVAFYSVFLTVLVQGIQGQLNTVEILRSFLPVSTNAYWFFTQYFVLCFLTPFINKLVLTISLKQNALLVGVLLLFFSVMPFIYAIPVDLLGEFKEDLFFVNRGYSVLWMAVMYTLGAFINRLANEDRLGRVKKYVFLMMFVLSDLLIWVVHYICVNGQNPVSQSFIVAYTSPFVVLSAAGMVMFFSRLELGKGAQRAIAFFSPGAFAVYIIHHHPQVYPIFKECVSPLLEMRVIKLVPCILFTVLFVFVVCSVSDTLRRYTEKLLKIDKLCRKADKLVNRIAY